MRERKKTAAERAATGDYEDDIDWGEGYGGQNKPKYTGLIRNLGTTGAWIKSFFVQKKSFATDVDDDDDDDDE